MCFKRWVLIQVACLKHRMDTCVGFANYRYFLLTLLYMEVGAMYAVGPCYPVGSEVRVTIWCTPPYCEGWRKVPSRPMPACFRGAESVGF